MKSIVAAVLVVSFVAVMSSSAQRRKHIQTVAPKSRVDYSRFSHRTHVTQQKLACDSCHKLPTDNWKKVRKGDEAFPDVADFPEHTACLNCHRPQFFLRERPAPAICSNCHIAVTPRDSTRWLFPSLGDTNSSTNHVRKVTSEFGVAFPHDKHLDTVGLLRHGSLSPPIFVNALFQQKSEVLPKSCPVCHQLYEPQGTSSDEYVTKPPKSLGDNFWLKKGTFETTPNGHRVCFSCHNSDLGIPPAPNDCGVCHKFSSSRQGMQSDFDSKLAEQMNTTDATILRQWSRRISAGTFRHEGGDHPGLSCLNCHKAANTSFSTMEPKTMKVPVQSCGGAEGCHITATADDGGILNYEIDQKKANASFVCTKCHVRLGASAIPDSHNKAIAALKKS